VSKDGGEIMVVVGRGSSPELLHDSGVLHLDEVKTVFNVIVKQNISPLRFSQNQEFCEEENKRAEERRG
jgi:hypothetical protein